MTGYGEEKIMDEVVFLKDLTQLVPYINDKQQVVEIILRNSKQQFTHIIKAKLADPGTAEAAEKMTKAIRDLANTNKELLFLSNKNFQVLWEVMNMQQAIYQICSLNYFATVAGFALLAAKLDHVTEKLTQQIEKVREQLKKGQDVNVKHEFRKAISDHADMLDCQKKQRPYSEEKLRELVDREYNVLVLLIDVLKQDLVSDRETMLVSVFSLLSMLTVSLQRFDETYYYANREVLADKNVWHTAHDKWMGVYDTLSEQWFTEMLQDYGIFDAKLTTQQTDAYYNDLLEQVRSQRQAVEGNQELILQLESEEDLRAVREYIERTVQKEADAFQTLLEQTGVPLAQPQPAVN